MCQLVIRRVFFLPDKTGDDLEVESEKLRQLNTLLLQAMQNARLAKTKLDADGNPTNLVIDLSGTSREVQARLVVWKKKISIDLIN